MRHNFLLFQQMYQVDNFARQNIVADKGKAVSALLTKTLKTSSLCIYAPYYWLKLFCQCSSI
jgi:hypothetical protein